MANWLTEQLEKARAEYEATPPWKRVPPLRENTVHKLVNPASPLLDPFNLAAFYECDEHAESFRHKTVADALAGYLDDCCDLASCADPEVRVRFGDASKIIEDFCGKHGPIVVYAHKRGSVDAAFTSQQAHRAVEFAVEEWAEEYGGPDADVPDSARDHIETARVRMQLVLRQLFAELPVWNCERVGERSFLACEVIEIVRAKHPGWFDTEGT